MLDDHLLLEGLFAAFRDRHRTVTQFCRPLCPGIENRRDHARVLRGLAVVVHFGANRESGFAGPDFRSNEGSPLLHVDGIGFDEPDVAVDAGALVEPAVARRGIHANQQNIAAAGIGEIGDVETERIVAAAVAADVEAVEDHHRLAVGAVELEGDALACVVCRKLENAAIPADARRGIVAAQRIEAFAEQRGIVLERQLDGPVVRQIDGLPVAVVEGEAPGGKKIARLLEVAGSSAAEFEVLGRIVGVAEMKAPAEIEQQAFAPAARRRRFARGSCGEWGRALLGGFDREGHGAHPLDSRDRCRCQQTGLQKITA